MSRLIWVFAGCTDHFVGFVMRCSNIWGVVKTVALRLENVRIYSGIWASSWENLFMSYANNTGADQSAHRHSLISTFVVRYLDSIIRLLAKSKISRLACLCSWAGLSLTWTETPKTDFLMRRLILQWGIERGSNPLWILEIRKCLEISCKSRTPEKRCCYYSKIWPIWFYHPKHVDEMANSEGQDQTVPLAVWSGFAPLAVWSGFAPLAVWSGFSLFAQTCLIINLLVLFLSRDSDSEGDIALEGETESEKNKPAGKASKKDKRKKKKDDDW